MKLFCLHLPGLIEVRRIDTKKVMIVPEQSLIPLKQIRTCVYCGHTLQRENQPCCKEVHNDLVWVTDHWIEDFGEVSGVLGPLISLGFSASALAVALSANNGN